MKLSSLALLLGMSVLLTACGSLSNPFANWFHGNHDQRVYNPQTGQWDYPNATPAPNRSAAVANAMGGQQTSDGRYFDPQKNQWVEMHNSNGPAQSAPGTEPAPSGPNPAASAPLPTPPPPRPARDTGIYNPTTGKIEWQSSGGTAPSYASTATNTKPKPAKVKHWWWPF